MSTMLVLLALLIACSVGSSFRLPARFPAVGRAQTLKDMSMQDVRTFASYNVYKGKGACTIKPIAPTFGSIGATSRNVAREGALYFEFAPIKAPREYDWGKKITFSLSVTECGEIARLKEGTTKPAEFLHDPNLGTPEAGKLTKKMAWTPTPDSKGMFVSLSVSDKSSPGGSSSCSIPMSWAEIEVIKTLVVYCIPRFLAFDKAWTEQTTGGSDYQASGQGQGQGYQASKGQWSSSQPSQPSQDSNPTPYWN